MVDENTLITVSDYLSNGGVAAIIFILLLILVGLLFERNRLLKRSDTNQKTVLESKENELTSIKEIIERYHEGNMNLSRTLAEIKMVLESIQRRRD